MKTTFAIKNLHKKLLNTGVLITPISKNGSPLNNYIDFNYKNISFLNYNKYSLQFYEIFNFLQLIKNQALQVIYVHGTETVLTNQFQLFARILNANYFVGEWVNGFFTNNLYLSKRNMFLKKNNIRFSCPNKPHIAIVFWSTNVEMILKELHDSGIVTILIGHSTSQNYAPSFYLPGGDLSLKNYLFYFLFFINIFSPQTNFAKIDGFDINRLILEKC